MGQKTYYVANNSIVKRLDNLTLPWIDLSAFDTEFGSAVPFYDVMADPTNTSKVWVTGVAQQRYVTPSLFTGIAYSTNAGLNWYSPGMPPSASYTQGLPSPLRVYEVWAVSDSVVYASANGGYVLKSTNANTLSPSFSLVTPITLLNQGIQDCYSIHFQDPNIGVVGLGNRVVISVNGGTTWTETSGTAFTNAGVERIPGVYCRINSTTKLIVAVADKGIFTSTDGGGTYTRTYCWGGTYPNCSSVTQTGRHLTWYTNNAGQTTFWATGAKNEIVTSTDGINWTTFNGHTYSGLSINDYNAAHFFESNKGFLGYGIGNVDYYDSGETPSDYDSTAKGIQAIWTGVDPKICYSITNCVNTQVSYTTDSDLSAYVNPSKVITNISINGEQSLECWTVTIANCVNNPTTVVVSAAKEYVDCTTCLSRCYKLINCADPEDVTIFSTTDDVLTEYIYQSIQVDFCPGKCFYVTDSDVCEGSVAFPNDVVITAYTDCNICLGKPPVDNLRTRSIKPGFYTPGCPPEYTVKTSCMYGEQLYDEMVAVRYGITICCDHDIDKWDIKKQLLELNALKDDSLCTAAACPENSDPCNVTATATGYEVYTYNPPAVPPCDPPQQPIIITLTPDIP